LAFEPKRILEEFFHSFYPFPYKDYGFERRN